MTKAEFEALKARAEQIRERSDDMGVLVDAMLKLPPGQLKKFLSEEVLAVLEKYGYVEG